MSNRTQRDQINIGGRRGIGSVDREELTITNRGWRRSYTRPRTIEKIRRRIKVRVLLIGADAAVGCRSRRKDTPVGEENRG
jgi:hypothetical protein